MVVADTMDHYYGCTMYTRQSGSRYWAYKTVENVAAEEKTALPKRLTEDPELMVYPLWCGWPSLSSRKLLGLRYPRALQSRTS